MTNWILLVVTACLSIAIYLLNLRIQNLEWEIEQLK